MTQRERQTSGGAFTAPPGEGGGANRGTPPFPVPCTLFWEEVFRSASPAEQTEWLSLVRQQGLLYAHQMGPLANGAPSSSDNGRQLLHQLLVGKTEGLQPLLVPPILPTDPPLDESQREAVAKALETPDICLIQGLPGTGKSRVVAEVVTRAAGRGERVLLLAPTATALDHVLESIARQDVVCALRCLGRDEPPESLPPSIRALTFGERLCFLREKSLDWARGEVQRTEERLARRRSEEPLWFRLAELATRQEQLSEQMASLLDRRRQIPNEVAGDLEAAEHGETTFPAFSVDLANLAATRDQLLEKLHQSLGDLQQQRAKTQNTRDRLADRWNRLHSLLVAKKQKRWWTLSWWRALLQRNVLRQGQEIQDQQAFTEKTLVELERQSQLVLAQQKEAWTRYQAERDALREAQIQRQLDRVRIQEAAVRQEQQVVLDKWQTGCQEFSAETPRPEAITRTAVGKARNEWHVLKLNEEQHLAFARHWADFLQETVEAIPERLLSLVNLVAATIASLPADEHYGDATARTVPFDLLVLERAHEVTESEFLRVARRARRWVLVGEPVSGLTVNGLPEAHDAGSGSSSARNLRRLSVSRTLRPSALRPGFFQRLWNHLHCDLRRLPYRWFREKGGLCCQLRALNEKERRHLESERVADCPDIELRIATLPGRPPFLAEVVFPPSVSIYEAKAYIFRELAELPINPHGHNVHWVEKPNHIRLCLTDSPLLDPVPVTLGNGVREIVGTFSLKAGSPGSSPPGAAEPGSPLPWHTCCLEFDRQEGWGWPKVQEWVYEHLGIRDPGRAVWLPTLHRMKSQLALFLADVLFQEGVPKGWAPPGKNPAAGQGTVQFLAVPSLVGNRHAGDRRGSRNEGGFSGRGRLVLPRTGGGLETDLADSRHGDRLPTDLGAALPCRGLVNFLEAQAVVRTLEKLALEAPAACPPLPVAVIALYNAQVELIRLLIERSPVLSPVADAPGLPRGRLALRVDVPSGCCEQEWPTVLVSLTRSHAHRAVTYGEGPQLLELALTRAQDSLWLIGDPGTLARRSLWSGPLDHLDENGAARERQVIGKLVGYLQGEGRHPETFHLL